ncbi:hypothetical protein ROHU_004476 [Labeo rohita]|uniref:Uncharacterized protein n=1 Tax=Labeo rohita TaxID=84645 RepID=A0A498NLL5_LABRO|nr:hypothetical protein ROHU_004476 [Labeo rohita]
MDPRGPEIEAADALDGPSRTPPPPSRPPPGGPRYGPPNPERPNLCPAVTRPKPVLAASPQTSRLAEGLCGPAPGNQGSGLEGAAAVPTPARSGEPGLPGRNPYPFTGRTRASHTYARVTDPAGRAFQRTGPLVTPGALLPLVTPFRLRFGPPRLRLPG